MLSSAFACRPVVTSQAMIQPKRQRSQLMVVSQQQEQPSSSPVDRRRILPLFLLPALLPAVMAPPAQAARSLGLGKDTRELLKAKEARKAKLKEAAEAMKAKGKSEDAFKDSEYSLPEDARFPTAPLSTTLTQQLAAPSSAVSQAATQSAPKVATKSAVAVVVAAAAAVAGTFASTALCESPAADNTNGDAPVDTVTVRQALHDLWVRLEEQLHRFDASQPQGHSLPHIPPPEIECTQDQVTVAFSVPQQLNIQGGATELRRILSSPRLGPVSGGAFASASTSETSSSGPKGVARRIRRSSSNAKDTLTVDILEPYDPREPARFEFRGACTRDNLKLVEAVMQQATQPRSAAGEWLERGKGAARRAIPPWFGNLGDEELEAGLEQFFEPLRDLVNEFERLHSAAEHSWGIFEGEGQGANSERDTLPTPLRRPPKRFDDFGADQPIYPGRPGEGKPSYGRPSKADAAIKKLRDMGCQVFLPTPEHQLKEEDTPGAPEPSASVDWGQLAGYDEQKREIEDSLLLPLVRPDVYDKVAKGTREKFAPNRPRAVLFVGPPGTGKTTSARVIASQAAVPLVYIPLEALVSKWYGESEKSLASALEAADSLPDGCIVFLDELDALATSRGGEMHEATRRLLGVLLRHMDGFDASKRSVVVGATNRPQDLDPALLSRFSATVEFGLPDETCRAAILKQYAHHLKQTELGVLAGATPGMAGRDLRDVCEQAERRWAAKIIRGQAPAGGLPALKEYLDAANARLKEMGNAKVKPFRLPPLIS